MKNYVKANFFQRVCAYTIDIILLFVLNVIASVLLSFIPFIQIVVCLFYGAVFIWKCGATPGLMVLNLKVVTTTYKSVSFGTAFVRGLAEMFISSIFCLGYLWMLIDKKNQTWHDKLANTYVVILEKGKLKTTTKPIVVTKTRKIAFWILLFNPLNLAPIFLFVYTFLFRPFQISGDTMNPNLSKGEYVLSSMQYEPLKRGDIIMFHSVDNKDKDKDYIKRVIGLPGEKVMLNLGSVYINDIPLDESAYLPEESRTYSGNKIIEGQEYIVPENSYFVLGDNRPYSADSREYGFVPKEKIISKFMFCYWNCK